MSGNLNQYCLQGFQGRSRWSPLSPGPCVPYRFHEADQANSGRNRRLQVVYSAGLSNNLVVSDWNGNVSRSTATRTRKLGNERTNNAQMDYQGR